MTYATIGKRAQRVSQIAFLRLLRTRPGLSARSAHALGHRLPDGSRAGRARRPRACPARTIALRFAREDGGESIDIETTRPELIPACVALVAHPDDERYKPLFDTHVMTPLFGVKVPVWAHALADPEKGSGIAMICTFGDITDVTWWRELSVCRCAPSSRPNGTLKPITWGSERLGVDRRGSRAAALRPDGSPRQPPRRRRRSSSCFRPVGRPR
ncbi:MAG: hypothetical protein QM736_13005 [Vicinamibacterales bacterium]